MKFINVVGARPQFVKYYPVSLAIEEANKTGKANQITDVLVHTGQHYDYHMSKLFFDQFGIREPDYHLEVRSGNHGAQTARILERVEKLLIEENPDAVITYGDTNSTLGAALAAAKLHIPVVHVEAGLRSFNKLMPEEINRILTDQVSTFLLCPCRQAVTLLEREGFSNIYNRGLLVDNKTITVLDRNMGIDKNNPLVINVGDVMFDLLRITQERAKKRSTIMDTLRLEGKQFNLLTMHRPENTDYPGQFKRIISFVNEVTSGITVILPMHPRTKKIYANSPVKFADNIRIIEPVSYFDLLMLLTKSSRLLTDSGGMQKEAYWLKVPCITLREQTEWVETVESGWNVLYRDYTGDLTPPGSSDSLLYGDSHAAEKFIRILTQCFFDPYRSKEQNAIFP
jgi:UDP-GlcNAc3NAcA epimerase